MMTAIARFERTHTVSRVEAMVALIKYIKYDDQKAFETFESKMAITQSYNYVFSRLLEMREDLSDGEFAKIIENTFKEADHQTAVIIVNRMKLLYWHPFLIELVSFAGQAHPSGKEIIRLANQLARTKRMLERQALVSEIEKHEKLFVVLENSFSRRCSDLAEAVSSYVNNIVIFLLILCVAFTCLLTYLITKLVFRQVVAYSSDLENKIQALKLAEGELRQSETTFRKLFEDSSNPILLLNDNSVFVECNQSALDLLKMTREQLLLKLPEEISPEYQPNGRLSTEAAKDMIRIAYRDGLHRFDWSCVDAEGSEFIVDVSLMPLVIKGKQMLHATWRDITKLKEHQKQLEYIAHFDTLTGLPNRNLLADRLKQAINQTERRDCSIAVAFLDLDGFKLINDRYGHEIGDKLLVEISRRMKDTLREGDTLCRIGGDEFIAVLVDLERAEDCEPELKRLLTAVAAPFTIENSAQQVSASIGVTLYPKDSVDADQLVRHADQAMYVAKQKGKNQYHFFDIDHNEEIRNQQQTIDDVKCALDQDEFVLFYQPKVNIKNREIIGFEALIRWQHPERGLVPPTAFLPIIENHPISVELGEWVINKALSQMSEWQKRNLDIPVSVNVAAIQLQKGFVEMLSRSLERHSQIKPSSLQLEILESTALDDVADISSVMADCVDLGVSFALDDFGTGFSSLSHLKLLPADMLKIDQSFVRDMLEDQDDRAIVTGVIGLATAFKRDVIAEGVETLEHCVQLLAMGCHLVQGYGIARPMPSDDIPAWVSKWTEGES